MVSFKLVSGLKKPFKINKILLASLFNRWPNGYVKTHDHSSYSKIRINYPGLLAQTQPSTSLGMVAKVAIVCLLWGIHGWCASTSKTKLLWHDCCLTTSSLESIYEPSGLKPVHLEHTIARFPRWCSSEFSLRIEA